MHQAASLAKAQGKAPGAVEEAIRNAHGSVLDWRVLLRRYMTDAARSDYTWSLPNRRFIDGGLYLPSIRSEGIEAIAVIIDTSASLPAETLSMFWSEVREIAAELRPESVVVLQVDAALQDVPSIRPATGRSAGAEARQAPCPGPARRPNGGTTMTDTNITEEHRRAFSALTSGDCENFALFSCFCDGRPTAAIAAVTVHPPAHEDGEAEYRVSPLFIGLTPDMTLTDHDGREA